MGSLLPILDLNASPNGPQSAPNSALDAAMMALKSPKLNLKPSPTTSGWRLLLLLNPNNPNSPWIPSQTPPSQTSIVPPDQENVFSEFHRISELFHTAFAKGSQNCDGDEDGVVLNPESGAIVPVSQEENQLAEVVQRKKYPQRSNELVRVTDLSDEDHRIVGSIPGVYVGDLFFFRMELCVVGIHGQVQAGIDYLPGSQSSNREPIATSIIVSGGYEDDEDAGDVIIYTGHGGQDKFNRQCAHQKLEGGNLALERSMHYGIEVRVIRGKKIHGAVSSKVYVYDGLYRILETWLDVGKSGFGVYKFKLLRIEGQPEMGSSILKFAEGLRSRPLTVRPRGYLSMDISQNKEKIPVFLFNDIDSDQDPLYYDYLTTPAFPTHVYQQSAHGTGCECVVSCSENCFCAMKNGGEFPYDQNGFLLRGKPVIFECGTFCRCPPRCRNRVTQNGLTNRLEVFRSRETGWGVRSLDLIHADGQNGEIYLRYILIMCAQLFPAIPPLDFAMDVSKMRNVACYMSQSTTPNVMVQLVLYDHNNLMFPHLMLFAMENIPPLRELSLDYGVAEEWTGKLAICN
ncbi:hypothetical protein M0R45_018581 [Rubus argutus]|uniref:Uncharacterized protein n=1 Tax=Rubus argutus TaxID=59490 RepID=A0AAW1X3V2_RUBAR